MRPTDTTALEGTTVTVGCQGQAEDIPVSTWYRINSQGRRALMPGSFNDIEVTSNGQLVIQVKRVNYCSQVTAVKKEQFRNHIYLNA